MPPDQERPPDEPTHEPEVIGGEGLIDRLRGAEVIRRDDDGDDLRLTDPFWADWRERIVALRDDAHARDELAAAMDVEREAVALEAGEDAFVVSHDGEAIGEWPSRAAFLSDLALDPTLREWLPMWQRLDGLSRGELLTRLRGFLEACPVCDGAVDLSASDASGDATDVSVACSDCGQVLVSGELE